MSQQDVEDTKAAYQAFAQGDQDAAAQNFADDVQWVTSDEVPPAGGTTTGKDNLLQVWAQIPDFWSDFSVQPDEFIDAGDKVIVLGTQRATAKDTGQSFEARFVHVLYNRDGKVVKGEFFADSAKALKALGG
jgi:uncharacterized protein